MSGLFRTDFDAGGTRWWHPKETPEPGRSSDEDFPLETWFVNCLPRGVDAEGHPPPPTDPEDRPRLAFASSGTGGRADLSIGLDPTGYSRRRKTSDAENPEVRRRTLGMDGGSPGGPQKAEPKSDTNPGEPAADRKSGLVWHDPVRRD